MTVGQRPGTAEALLRTPDDGLRRKLVRGEVRTMAPAGNVHGRIPPNIGTPLHQYVRTNGLGAAFAAGTGFKIFGSPDTVRAPDTAFVRQEHAQAVGEAEGYRPGAPDLAVEVVSRSDRFPEVEKDAGWLAAATRRVILANPRGKTVTVRRPEREAAIPSERGTIEGGGVVPGWRRSPEPTRTLGANGTTLARGFGRRYHAHAECGRAPEWRGPRTGRAGRERRRRRRPANSGRRS